MYNCIDQLIYGVLNEANDFFFLDGFSVTIDISLLITS